MPDDWQKPERSARRQAKNKPVERSPFATTTTVHSLEATGKLLVHPHILKL
jgi:hypothetical protein